MAKVLGKNSFLDIPDVNGNLLLVELNPAATGTGSFTMPVGTTGQRPGSPVAGMIRFNSTLGAVETYNGSSWSSGSGVSSVSGTINEIDVTGTSAAVVGLASNPVIPGIESLTLPKGTTGQRPGSPVAGMSRFNTTLSKNEYYDGTSWVLSGRLIQMVTGTVGTATTNSVIPYDGSTPQSSEGVQIWSRSFTPLMSNSTILIMTRGFYTTGTGGNRWVTLSTFSGTTCISATLAGFDTTTDGGQSYNVVAVRASGSTSSRTYSVRIGSNNSNGTLYINRGVNGEDYGGTVNAGAYIIQEIAP